MSGSLLKDLLLNPLLEQKRRLGAMVPALLFMAAGNTLLLLLMKGFTKALFQGPGRATIPLTELLPDAVWRFAPELRSLEVSSSRLALAVPLAILVAGVVKASATYVYQVSQQALALHVARRYRERLFEALVSLPYSEIKRRPAGEWMSLIMNDVALLQNRFSDVLQVLVRDSVAISAAFLVVLVLHWPTALILAMVAPVIAWGMGRTGRRIARYAEVFQRELARLSGGILDLRARFDFIRSQGGEAFERQRFQRINLNYYRMILKSIFVRSAFAPALEFLGFSLFALAVLAFSKGALPGFKPEVVLQFFMALGIMLKPLKEVGEQLARWHETKGALAASMATFERIRELGARPAAFGPSRARTRATGLSVKKIRAGLGGETRFEAEGLRIPSGKAIAVIGPSGAGKSTLLKTLAGLVEPLEWDAEAPWREAAEDSSMVSQEPFLFDGTLTENLTYGLPPDLRPTDDELWAALRLVNIEAEVRSWPAGFGARIFAVGSNVSGGQLQRLVIARGLLRRKSLWLLDEATSAIDAATERDITHRLIEACRNGGQSLLAVTHRLTWLESFDEVWFIEHGRVAFAGPHKTLLREPRYRDYCDSETEGREG